MDNYSLLSPRCSFQSTQLYISVGFDVEQQWLAILHAVQPTGLTPHGLRLDAVLNLARFNVEPVVPLEGIACSLGDGLFVKRNKVFAEQLVGVMLLDDLTRFSGEIQRRATVNECAARCDESLEPHHRPLLFRYRRGKAVNDVGVGFAFVHTTAPYHRRAFNLFDFFAHVEKYGQPVERWKSRITRASFRFNIVSVVVSQSLISVGAKRGPLYATQG